MILTLEKANELMNRNGGWLDLSGTGITALPDNLTVGDWLNLRGTGITALPENLTVGGSLYLSGAGITGKKVKNLHDGDYKEGHYLYADGILTHIKKKKTFSGYAFFLGKIPGKNVVYDGKNYAYCSNLREGIADLIFKSASDRGASQYKDLSLDTEMSVDELVTMYRVITGACRQGSQSFVDSFGSNLKERYTILEVIELTKGQYGGRQFEEFFSS